MKRELIRDICVGDVIEHTTVGYGGYFNSNSEIRMRIRDIVIGIKKIKSEIRIEDDIVIGVASGGDIYLQGAEREEKIPEDITFISISIPYEHKSVDEKGQTN